MSINEGVNAVLIAVNVWWMLRLFIGLCEPPRKRGRRVTGKFVQDDADKPK